MSSDDTADVLTSTQNWKLECQYSHKITLNNSETLIADMAKSIGVKELEVMCSNQVKAMSSKFVFMFNSFLF